MRNSADQKGFTFIEILVAMFILGFGILGVASLQVSSTRGNAVGKRITEATTLAAERLEILRNLPYDHNDLQDVVTGSYAGTAGLLEASDANSDHQPPASGNYKVYWNVAVDNPVVNVKTVTVLVVPVLGGQQPVVLTTVIPEVS